MQRKTRAQRPIPLGDPGTWVAVVFTSGDRFVRTTHQALPAPGDSRDERLWKVGAGEKAHPEGQAGGGRLPEAGAGGEPLRVAQ